MTKEGAATRPKDACTPEFPGRVIAALACDPDVMRHSGGTFITAELAREYLTEVMITPQSGTVGKTLDELDWAQRQGQP